MHPKFAMSRIAQFYSTWDKSSKQHVKHRSASSTIVPWSPCAGPVGSVIGGLAARPGAGLCRAGWAED